MLENWCAPALTADARRILSRMSAGVKTCHITARFHDSFKPAIHSPVPTGSSFFENAPLARGGEDFDFGDVDRLVEAFLGPNRRILSSNW